MWSRRRLIFFFVVSTFLVLATGAVWSVGWTAAGSAWLVRTLAGRFIPAKELAINRIDGSLAGGLVLQDVTIGQLPGWWQESHLEIERVEVAPLGSLLRRRGGLVGSGVNWRSAPFAGQATASRIDVLVSGRWAFHDITVLDAEWFREGSVLEVQRSEADWPLQFDRLRVIENARLRLPLSEPILLAGSQQHGRFALTLYAKTLDVHEVVTLVTRAPAWQSLTGIVNDLDASIEGPVNGLMWRGSWQVTRLSRYDFTIMDCPGTFALAMRGLPATLMTEGDITCQAGTVSSRQTVASLLPSQVIVSSQPLNAAFDVQATSTVGGTPIRIALRGTAQQPDLRLTSTPPLPQGVLLAMLVTGKQWKGAQDALTQGVISSDLALDFIDYFVLGGLGGKIAGRFGISGLSLRHDPETNRVGVETTLVDRVSVDVEVEPSTLTSGAPSAPSTSTDASAHRSPIPYKVGAEYKVNETTAVRLEGERTVLDRTASTSASTTDTDASPTGPQTDDKVLLKFKKQF